MYVRMYMCVRVYVGVRPKPCLRVYDRVRVWTSMWEINFVSVGYRKIRVSENDECYKQASSLSEGLLESYIYLIAYYDKPTECPHLLWLRNIIN